MVLTWRWLLGALSVVTLVLAWSVWRRSSGESKGHSARVTARALAPGEILQNSVDLSAQAASLPECGVRSLCVVLHLAGKRVAIEEVRRLVPIGPRGSSLYDLGQASKQLGYPMRAVFCRPASLGRLPLPAIAQVEPTHPSPLGHYIVLLEVTEDRVTVCDAGLGRILQSTRSEFLQHVTGYYLVAEASVFSGPLAAIGTLALSGLVALVIFLWRGRHSSIGKAVTTTALLCILLSAAGCRNEPRANSGVPELRSVIQISSPTVDFGVMRKGTKDEVHRSVEVHNRGDRPCRLNLSPASCGCIRTKFHPSNELAPGGKLTIVLFPDISGRRPGDLTETFLLTADGLAGYERIRVSGLVEGLVVPQNYVVRPTDFARNQVPRLRMQAMTKRPSTPLEIVAVSSESPLIAADLKGLRIFPAEQQLEGFSRTIEVPMRVQRPTRSLSAKMIVEYRLDGKTASEEVNGLLLIE
ncbi:MAG: cysteine peptidase family C39 domain-containing protein [Thermoguttaceae bacterium]|jgi:hypothetical protein|nr:cysteine peptidase family C39 domain-containing protein [Thermoguttaceae bacterium]